MIGLVDYPNYLDLITSKGNTTAQASNIARPVKIRKKKKKESHTRQDKDGTRHQTRQDSTKQDKTIQQDNKI